MVITERILGKVIRMLSFKYLTTEPYRLLLGEEYAKVITDISSVINRVENLPSPGHNPEAAFCFSTSLRWDQRTTLA